MPAPKNDYEIVVPEEEMNEEETAASSTDIVEDQADVDARKQQELIEQRKRISINFIIKIWITQCYKSSYLKKDFLLFLL